MSDATAPPPYSPVLPPERLTVVASERRQKNHLVGVRLDDNEHADLTRLAQDLGLTLPDALRLGLTLLTIQEAVNG